MSRRGFTLIEVIVALTLTGIAASLALAIFANVSDSLTRLSSTIESHDREANARVWLREVFASMEPASRDETGFVGRGEEVAFLGHIWASNGGRPTVRIVIALKDGALVAEPSMGSPVTLVDGLAWGLIDYVVAYGESIPPSPIWESRISLPLAVRLRLARRTARTERVDTLLFWVGSRA